MCVKKENCAMKSVFFLALTLCAMLHYKALALRDPFSCRHAHGKITPQAPQAVPAFEQPKTTSFSDDPSSEWRVIAEKDGAIIMQHKDGSIREIVVQ